MIKVVTSDHGSITYVNGEICRIESFPVEKPKKKKRKINWKYFVHETLIPCTILMAMEFAFIAYIFHRLGCF